MIFQSKGKVRLYIFRGTVLVFFSALLILGLNLAGNLLEPYSSRDPLPYGDALESYHYYYGAATKGKIAFTFDDGPDPKYTLSIANTLKRNDVPATFFFIGSNILKWPGIVRQIHNLGFEIGNHTFTHSYAVHDSLPRLKRELGATSYLIERLTGEAPMYYRPPYLLAIGIDPAPNPYIDEIPAITWSLDLGYIPVGTDIDSVDWKAITSEEIKTNSYSGTREDHIILFHDVKLTEAALDDIIVTLKSRGYKFVSLEELLIPPTTFSFNEDVFLGDTDEKTAGAISNLQWFLYKTGYLDGYALTGIKRLGEGFDLVAQYQGQWRDQALISVQSSGLDFEQVGQIGFTFNWDATLNQHISPRRTILNQQHQYIPN